MRSEFGLRLGQNVERLSTRGEVGGGCETDVLVRPDRSDLGEVRNKMFMCNLIEPIGVAAEKAGAFVPKPLEARGEGAQFVGSHRTSPRAEPEAFGEAMQGRGLAAEDR